MYSKNNSHPFMAHLNKVYWFKTYSTKNVQSSAAIFHLTEKFSFDKIQLHKRISRNQKQKEKLTCK